MTRSDTFKQQEYHIERAEKMISDGSSGKQSASPIGAVEHTEVTDEDVSRSLCTS